MLYTLSWQRMQLSADPNDWIWVRWKWAQPGAKLMPWPHAFGSPLWHRGNDEEVDGPQIHMLPSKYAKSRVSSFPGDHVIGDRSWWEDGLPMSARLPGSVGPGCNGEIWGVNLRVTLGLAARMLTGGSRTMTGGQKQGGSFFHWTGELMDLELLTSARLVVSFGGPYFGVMTGGQKQGGSFVGRLNGYGAMTGGQKQGGSFPGRLNGYWQATGGQKQGGSFPGRLNGYGAMTGGQKQGGSFPGRLNGYALATGGQKQGGTWPGVLSAPPSPPTFISGGQANGLGTATFTPISLSAGDLVLAFVWASGSTTDLTMSSPWVRREASAWGGGTPSARQAVFWQIWPGGSSSGEVVTGHTGDSIKVGYAVFRYTATSGPVSSNDHGTGYADLRAPSVSLGGPNSLLVCGYYRPSLAPDVSDPDDMTRAVPALPAVTPPLIYYQLVASGASGDKYCKIDDSGDWGALAFRMDKL